MKKNIGSVLGLYPTPLVVIGAMTGEKPNWVLAGHVGIMGHNRIMVSLAKAHYTNQGIKENGKGCSGDGSGPGAHKVRYGLLHHAG